MDKLTCQLELFFFQKHINNFDMTIFFNATSNPCKFYQELNPSHTHTHTPFLFNQTIFG